MRNWAGLVIVTIVLASLVAGLWLIWVNQPRPSSSPGASAPSLDTSPTPALASPSGDDAPPAPCTDCTIADLVPSLADLLAGFLGQCDFQDVQDPAKCVLGSASSRRVMAVFGDSFAGHWGPAFDEIGRTHDVRVIKLVRGICPSATVTVWNPILRQVNTECDQWREQAFTRIEAEQAEIVVLANINAEFLIDTNGERIVPDQTAGGLHSTLWVAGMEETITRLSSLGARIVVISQPLRPHIAELDPPACIATHATDFQEACQWPRSTMVNEVSLAMDQAAATAGGATFVDATPWLCDPVKCPAVIDRFIVYRDNLGHLTAPFAVSLGERLAKAVGLTDR